MPQKEVISGQVGEATWTARIEPLEGQRYLLDEVRLASGKIEIVGLVFSALEHLRQYSQEVAESMVSLRPRSSDG